jgi:cephalosporin-C deacetylase
MKRSLALLFVLAFSARLIAQDLVVTPDKPTGVYTVGDPVKWTVAYKANSTTAPAAPASIKYTLKKNGLKQIKEASVDMTDGQVVIDGGSFDAPGTLLLQISAQLTPEKTLKVSGGAVADPEKIGRSTPRPDDFDAFWDGKVAELATIPANPQVEPADGGKEGVEYFKITMDHWKGSKIHGQIAKPANAGDKKLPAMLIVQWAGVYPLQKGWVTDRAKEGWLAMNITAHDLPISNPAEFYSQQNAGPLKEYTKIGNDDRETSYFLRMYLSCYRAAEYLTGREDWDGKTFVVMGGSQGGQQSIVTAGLHPKVTAVMANVPAGCDLTGPAVDRACGWPNWWYAVGDKDAAKVRETGKYFDAMNFASRVKVPTLVGVGLVDPVCPPSGVIATFNQLAGPKELVIMPAGDHGKNHQAYYGRMGAWQYTLLRGQPAPVK